MAHLKRLFLLIGLLLTAAVASAQDDNVYGLIVEDRVDVRVGPDFAYPIVDQIPRDASVVLVGRAGNFYRSWDGRQWLQIQYGDNRGGWVLGRMVRMGRSFSSLPLTALSLPRDRDGRVPDVFDLSINICDRWQGAFTQSGNFMGGDAAINVTFPEMPGATNYIVVARGPSGNQRSLDAFSTSLAIELSRLNWEGGVYTWSVIPVWNITSDPFRAQQICVERVGGTFEKPDTTPPEYRDATPQP